MAPKKDPRQIILPCKGGAHRVRLAKGRRFLAKAHCPVCRAPVDPTRLHRILRWAYNFWLPLSRAPMDRAAHWGALGFPVLVGVMAFVLWGLGDRWWPATVLLFGPRWVFLLPLVIVLPLAALRDRALFPLLLLGGWICIGPLMGLEVSLGSLLQSERDPGELKVVSFNARSGTGLFVSPASLLAEWGADIVAIQECQGIIRESLAEIPGWHVKTSSSLCLASRFEIVGVQEMDRVALEFADGAGVVATFELDMDGSPLFVTNLHLETPRAGFELIREGRIRDGAAKIREKTFIRDVELRQSGAWADGILGPQVVLGDFNTPKESRSFRTAWHEWENAFSEAGTGFGGTRMNGWIRVRIDHILANEFLEITGARLENDVGSDHRPISAILRLN